MSAKEKISLFVLVALSLTLPTRPIFAQAPTKLCSIDDFTISTINGIFTDERGVADNQRQLRMVLKDQYHGEKLDYQYLLNPTHIGGLGDLAMAIYQKAFENGTVQDYDLIEMLNNASQKIKTQKLLLVAHSQGNFYANSFYDTVADKVGGVPGQSLGIYSVANPADRVAGGGQWITSDTDRVIAGVVARLPYRKIIPPNTHIELQPGDDSTGHGFSSIYLKYRGTQIVAEIRSSLDKLSASPNRREDAPCITPPRITIVHRLEGVALGAADNSANSLITTTTFASNAGLALANSTLFASSLIFKTAAQLASSAANSLSFVAHAVVGAPRGGITTSNSASVLLALSGDDTGTAESTSETSEAVDTPVPQISVEVPEQGTDVMVDENNPRISTTTNDIVDVASDDIPNMPEEASSTPLLALSNAGIDFGGGTPPKTQDEMKAGEVATSTDQTTPETSAGGSGGSSSATGSTASTTPQTATSTPNNQAKPKTVYVNAYIGTPVDVGMRESSSGMVSFFSKERSEDAYRVRVKKSSDFDCRTNLQQGYIFVGSGPTAMRIVELDPNSAITDGSDCEYMFTSDRPFLPTSIAVDEIFLNISHNGVSDFLDGSLSNKGSALNYYEIATGQASYAFQLCGKGGCDQKFELPPEAATSTSSGSGSSSSTLSTAKAITAFGIQLAATTLAGAIDESAHTISLSVPFGTDIRALLPIVEASSLATSSPASGVPQDFTIPVTYTVTAEDGSTQTYTATVTVLPEPALPLITNYTLNGIVADVTTDFASTTPTVTLQLTANKNVDWVSITIEDENNTTRYKRFLSGTGCVDGTSTCTKTWTGELSHGSVGLDTVYQIKVNIKDAAGNIYHDYLSPYKIIVKQVVTL